MTRASLILFRSDIVYYTTYTKLSNGVLYRSPLINGLQIAENNIKMQQELVFSANDKLQFDRLDLYFMEWGTTEGCLLKQKLFSSRIIATIPDQMLRIWTILIQRLYWIRRVQERKDGQMLLVWPGISNRFRPNCIPLMFHIVPQNFTISRSHYPFWVDGTIREQPEPEHLGTGLVVLKNSELRQSLHSRLACPVFLENVEVLPFSRSGIFDLRWYSCFRSICT